MLCRKIASISPHCVHTAHNHLSFTRQFLFPQQCTEQVVLLCARPMQVVTIEEAGPGRCRMTLGGGVSVGVPGLGPLAERVLVSSVSASLRLLPLLVRSAPLQWDRIRAAAALIACSLERIQRHTALACLMPEGECMLERCWTCVCLGLVVCSLLAYHANLTTTLDLFTCRARALVL